MLFDREDIGNCSQPNSPPPYQMPENVEYRLVSDGSDSNVPRRVYVRQEFTHENAAKGDTNGGVRRLIALPFQIFANVTID